MLCWLMEHELQHEQHLSMNELILLARQEIGRRAGLASARKLTPGERAERSRRAVTFRWMRYRAAQRAEAMRTKSR